MTLCIRHHCQNPASPSSPYHRQSTSPHCRQNPTKKTQTTVAVELSRCRLSSTETLQLTVANKHSKSHSKSLKTSTHTDTPPNRTGDTLHSSPLPNPASPSPNPTSPSSPYRRRSTSLATVQLAGHSRCFSPSPTVRDDLVLHTICDASDNASIYSSVFFFLPMRLTFFSSFF